MFAIGPCPTATVTSFLFDIEVPQAMNQYDTTENQLGFFHSPNEVTIRSGLWRCQYQVFFHAWQGDLPTDPAPPYHQQFDVFVNESYLDESNAFFTGTWPCNGSGFTNYDYPGTDYIGMNALPSPTDRPCSAYAMWDFGCPACNPPSYTIHGTVLAATGIYYGYAYAFRVRCIGTMIHL